MSRIQKTENIKFIKSIGPNEKNGDCPTVQGILFEDNVRLKIRIVALDSGISFRTVFFVNCTYGTHVGFV